MVDQIELVTFTTPATAPPTTYQVTHPNLTETVKAAVVFYSSRTADDTDHAHAVGGIGFAADDGVQLDAIGFTATGALQSEDLDAAAADTATVKANDLGGAAPNLIVAPTNDGLGNIGTRDEFVQFVAGGIELTSQVITNQTKAAALLFAGVARAVIGQIGATTVLQNEAVATPSTFRPHLIIIMGDAGAWTAAPTFGNDARASLGFVIDDGASSQVAFGADWDNGQTITDGDAEASTNRGSVCFEPTGRAINRVQFIITATGFSHQVVSGTDNQNLVYLAIQFTNKPDLFVGNLATPAGTGPAEFLTPGVVPRVVLGTIHQLAALDTPTDGAQAGGFGRFAFTRSNARAYGLFSQEGVDCAGAGSTNAGSRQGDHAVLSLSNTGTVAQQADLLSLEPGRFLLNFTTATAGWLTCLAIGSDPGAPGILRTGKRRARAAARHAAHRRRPAIPLGRAAASAPPFPRWLKAVMRMRAAMRARLRWRPPIPQGARTLGVPTDEPPKGRIFTPGLLRGRIYGGGVPSPELEDPPPWRIS
jgi:hypothetical protein